MPVMIREICDACQVALIELEEELKSATATA
jgi:hypothetical protein